MQIIGVTTALLATTVLATLTTNGLAERDNVSDHNDNMDVDRYSKLPLPLPTLIQLTNPFPPPRARHKTNIMIQKTASTSGLIVWDQRA